MAGCWWEGGGEEEEEGVEALMGIIWDEVMNGGCGLDWIFPCIYFWDLRA